MADVNELKVSKNEHPELFEQVEEALYNGESSVMLGDKTYEIVSSQISLDADASFVLVEV